MMKNRHPLRAIKENFIRKYRKFRQEENGAVMVIAAVSLVAFLSCAALVVDIGLSYYQKSELQNAMDAASLAGARYLPDKTKAQEVALEYVAKNGFDSSNVIVEFPSDSVIRVRDSYEGKTVFANLFDVKSFNIDAVAAAKYEEKHMAMDWDYLVYQGGNDTVMTLGGQFNIYGGIASVSNIEIRGSASNLIEGGAASRGTVHVTSGKVNGISNNDSLVSDMPDWSDMIMSIAPSKNDTNFNTRHYSHIQPPPEKKYSVNYNSNYYMSNLAEISGSMYINGDMTTKYDGSGLLIIWGDLYVAGSFKPTCSVWVKGNLYVGKDFQATGYSGDGKTFSITVSGSTYVEGDTKLTCPFKCINKCYFGGNVELGGSSAVKQIFNNEVCIMGNVTQRTSNSIFNSYIYCFGNYTKDGSTSLTFNSKSFIYGTVNWSTGGNYIYDDMYVYGYVPDSSLPKKFNDSTQIDICKFSGPMVLEGNLYSGNCGGKIKHALVRFSGQGGYDINGVIYSEGDIRTEQGGNGLHINGCVIAKYDVWFGGTPHMIDDNGATLSIYSQQGDITFTPGSGYQVWGVVYAPNGKITLNSGGTISGNLVAARYDFSPGGLTIKENDRLLPYTKSMKIAILVE